MADDLVFGPAEPPEYFDVATMHLQSWLDRHGGVIPKGHLQALDAIAFVQEYHHQTVVQRQALWVARMNGAPAAVAIFGPDPSDPTRGWIEALYVAVDKQRQNVPDYQRPHIGQRFLERILDELVDYRTVGLDCLAQNHHGCAFWESRGFDAAGAGKPYAVDGVGEQATVRYVLNRRTAAPPDPHGEAPRRAV